MGVEGASLFICHAEVGYCFEILYKCACNFFMCPAFIQGVIDGKLVIIGLCVFSVFVHFGEMPVKCRKMGICGILCSLCNWYAQGICPVLMQFWGTLCVLGVILYPKTQRAQAPDTAAIYGGTVQTSSAAAYAATSSACPKVMKMVAVQA